MNGRTATNVKINYYGRLTIKVKAFIDAIGSIDIEINRIYIRDYIKAYSFGSRNGPFRW